MNNTTELIRDGFFQIPQHAIEKFENQISNKYKSRPLEIFLNELIEKPYKSVNFQTPALCSRLLKLLKKTTLSGEQQVRIINFFREKNGLPQDLFENNVILTGNNNTSVFCSKNLLEMFFVFFKKVFESFMKKGLPDEGGKYFFNVPLGQEALHCFKEYVLTKKISSDDKQTLMELFLFSEIIDDMPFREACEEAFYSYLLDGKNKMNFDARLIYDKSNFTKSYLETQKIKYTTLDNGKYRINLSCFSKLFNQEKDIEILNLISYEIDRVIIDVDEQNFYLLNLIPKQYRKAILGVVFGQDIGDSPLKILQKLTDIFPNSIAFNLPVYIIETAIQFNKKDDFAHGRLGDVLRCQGQFEEAKKSFQTAIDLNPKSAFAHERLGDVLKQQGQLEEAKKFLHTAIGLNPKSAFAHERLGEMLRQQGKLQEAKKSLQTAIGLNPKSGFAHANLGDVLRQQGQLEEAKKSLQTAIELYPKSGFAHARLGDVLKKQGQLEEAKKFLQTAIELDPKSVFAHENLGDVLRQQGQLEDAKKSFQTAIDLNPKSAFAHENLGDVLRQQGQLGEAKISLQTAIDLNPKSAFAHAMLGDVLRQEGHLERAKESLQTAIELHPKSAFAHERLGCVLRQEGQLEEAKKSLQTAIALNLESAFAHAMLGDVLRQQGQLEEAKKSLIKAFAFNELDQKSAFAHENLGDVLRQQDQLEEAKIEEAKKFLEAIKLNSENAVVQAVFDNMRDILKLQHQFEEAKKSSQTALEPESGKLHEEMI